ncbi:MAG: hypothetical protein ACRECU_13145 [Methylocella sp.]
MFNQFGDLERCSLRSGNADSGEGWEDDHGKTIGQRGDFVAALVGRRRGVGPRLGL